MENLDNDIELLRNLKIEIHSLRKCFDNISDEMVLDNLKKIIIYNLIKLLSYNLKVINKNKKTKEHTNYVLFCYILYIYICLYFYFYIF